MEFNLERFRELEAHEWHRRFKQKVRELGKVKAVSWWIQTIDDIERKRGRLMAQELKMRIKRIQDASKKG